MPKITLSKLVFLPLLALVTIDLAPMADAQRSDKRGSSSSSSKSSSGSSAGRSSSGSSRQSGSRSSGFGGSTGGTTRPAPTPAPRVTPAPAPRVTPAPAPRVTPAPSPSPRVTGPTTSGSTRSSGSSSSQPQVRYITPSSSSTSSSGNTAPPSTGSTSSYSDSRLGSTSGTSTGEVNAATPAPARSRFPLPLTARDTSSTGSDASTGRTTYARRFEALGTSARAAAAERIRTENGISSGSVLGATDLADRAKGASNRSTTTESTLGNSDSSRTRVRSSSGPSARYRASLADASDKERTRQSGWDDASPETKARLRHKYGESASDAGLGGSTKEEIDSKERTRQSTWDNASPDTKARLRQVFDKKTTKQVVDTATAISRASGDALAAATRLTLGNGGSRALVSTFGGYDSIRANGLIGTVGTVGTAGTVVPGAGDGSDFDGYGTGTDDSSFWGYTGYPGSGYGCGPGFGYWDSDGYYHSPYSSWFGWGFGWCSDFGLSFGFGSPYWNPGYGYSPVSWYYPSVSYYYDSYDSSENYGDGYQDGYGDASLAGYADDPVVVNIYADGPVGETVHVGSQPGADVNISLAPQASSDGPLGAAALRYLELGDEAFGAGRYVDAIHFYSRSIEFNPDRGMLHLILADALFATGDYHYCARSIRKALELEPTLVAAPVDKHLFYAIPSEFDKQLAVLELYIADYKTDADARLVLGLNYLFGDRPQAAVELLESGSNTSASFSDEAAILILESAKVHQWGDQLPAEATWE